MNELRWEASCLHCQQPCTVTRSANGADAPTGVHTATGDFSCRSESGAPTGTFCEPFSTDSMEALIERAADEARAECESGHSAIEDKEWDAGYIEAAEATKDKVLEIIGRCRSELDLLTMTGKATSAVLENIDKEIRAIRP